MIKIFKFKLLLHKIIEFGEEIIESNLHIESNSLDTTSIYVKVHEKPISHKSKKKRAKKSMISMVKMVVLMRMKATRMVVLMRMKTTRMVVMMRMKATRRSTMSRSG